MKTIFLSRTNMLLASLLALLGFNSCGHIKKYGIPSPEGKYGVPVEVEDKYGIPFPEDPEGDIEDYNTDTVAEPEE